MWRSPLSRLGPALALCAVVALLVAGCGRSAGEVSGTVTYQGKVLKAGYVTFVSTDGGQTASAPIQEDGTYKIDKLLSGSYKVCVDTSAFKTSQGATPGGAAPSGPSIPKGANTGPPPDAQVPEGYPPSNPAAMAKASAAKLYVAIPPEYAKPDTTDITYEFKGGSDKFDIVLK